MYFTIANLSAR